MGRRSWSMLEEARLIGLVKLCKDSRQLKRIHSQLVVNGQSQNNFLITKLVREFAAFSDLKLARAVIDSVNRPNVYLWTAMIRGYSQRSDSESCCREAVLMYARMHRRLNTAMASNKAFAFTLSSVLKACTGLVILMQGMQVHAHVIKYGYHADVCIETTLVDFYAKCGLMEEAQNLFDKMHVRDVQAWNTMIAGHAKSRDMGAALSLFQRMPERNTFTWESMITGFIELGQMDRAEELFDESLLLHQGNMDINAAIYTAMIVGYAKCGDISNARLIFDKMVARDVVSWNAMISAYSQAGFFNEAMDLFQLMLQSGGNVIPNQTTIASVVPACAQLGSIKIARWIKDYIDSRGLELLNAYSVSALIDMHAKCGDPEQAYEMYKRWKDKDAVCYSSMISAFGMHGRGTEALKIFSELQQAGLKLDGICFNVVLSACSHAGLVEEGCLFFEIMQKNYSIVPTADHYMCMVDLLGRAGRIADAYKTIVEVMPPVKPHAGVWGALLSACRVYNNIEIGEISARHLLLMEPENAGNYVLLSNMYAKANRWEDVAKVRALMRSHGVKKPPGCSWIEVDGRTHRFLTGDVKDHSFEVTTIFLAGELKAQGYCPCIDHEGKEKIELKGHFPSNSCTFHMITIYQNENGKEKLP